MFTRRTFLASAALSPAGFHRPFAIADTPRTRPPKRAKPAEKKIAVVASVYHYLSHAYHIAGRFLDGYMVGDSHHFPEFGVASACVEQVKANDLSRDLAKEHGFRISPTIEDALTLGTGKLAVDGVLLICEHGDYAYNAKGQKLYPRHDYFRQIVKVFEKSGKTVPVFCDKHLSYDRAKAAEMVATANKMGFPLMAGSSLPVTWRRPELELPLGSKVKEALLASRGELEIYGIHALEALQCMVERRFKPENPSPNPLPAAERGLPPPSLPGKGVGGLGSDPNPTPQPPPRSGEGGSDPAPPSLPGKGVGGLGSPQQGVKAVTCLQGDAVWKAGEDGLWSWDLLEHALGRSVSRNAGDIRSNCRRFPRPATWGNFVKGPIAFLIEYLDGLKASVLQLDGHVADETFAAKLDDVAKPVSTLFWLPPPPGAAFLEALSSHVETFLKTGKPPYPIERTQLTGGILDCALESRVNGSKRVETPDLDIRYAPPTDSGYMRGDYAKPVK